MIEVDDLLHLPYTPDLTQGGIAYACRSLHYTYNRMGGSPYSRLRRIVGGIAVELAFRRALVAENVPHDVLGATHFTEPDRYDISLGGRRCDIKSYMITNREQILTYRDHPEQILNAHALVPTDQMLSDHLLDEDLYIFAFLTGVITPSWEEIEIALTADQPVYLLHPFPEVWARPKHWRPLGKLVMKTNFDHYAEIEIGGQGPGHDFEIKMVELAPHRRTPLPHDFYAVNYLYTPTILEGEIGIHSPVLKETHVLTPNEWGNIWVYGMKIVIAGYMTRGEFRRKAIRIPKGSAVGQYPRTQIENMGMPIRDLYPMPDLFIRAQNWAQRSRR